MNIKRYWSGKVTRESNALDLEEGVFTFHDPEKIAISLKNSAENSDRRKAAPFQSAMSMLNFYINRAGINLDPEQMKILQQAKERLRQLFHHDRNSVN
jgi:hypothetical protein